MNVPRRLLALAVVTLAAVGGALTLTARAADPAHPKVESHGDAAAHGGHGEDKPELLPKPSAGIIPALTSLVVFGILVVVLGKTAWGPIAKGLQDREDKIRRDIEEAEAARARAEASLKEYQAQLATAEAKVREMIAKAATDAENISTNIRMQAEQDAAAKKDAALRDIDVARREAVRQVGEQAAVLATSVAEKILRRNLNPDDQRDLVAASLDQLQTVKG